MSFLHQGLVCLLVCPVAWVPPGQAPCDCALLFPRARPRAASPGNVQDDGGYLCLSLHTRKPGLPFCRFAAGRPPAGAWSPPAVPAGASPLFPNVHPPKGCAPLETSGLASCPGTGGGRLCQTQDIVPGPEQPTAFGWLLVDQGYGLLGPETPKFITSTTCVLSLPSGASLSPPQARKLSVQ